VSEKAATNSAAQRLPLLRSWFFGVALGFGIALVAAVVSLRWTIPASPPRIMSASAVTNDGLPKCTELATDGPRIYFSVWKNRRAVLAHAPAPGGETEFVPSISIGPDMDACLRGISPDAQRLIIATGKQFTSMHGFPLWLMATSGSTARRMGELIANDADWSPDGQRLAYVTGNQVWLAERDFRNRRKLVEHQDLLSYPRWSPDGQRIRFTSLAWQTLQNTIWEVDADGGHLHPVLPGWPAEQWGGRWMPRSEYFVFNSESNVWALHEPVKEFWPRKHQVAQLTFGPLRFGAPLPSRDGHRIYAVGQLQRGELLRYDVKKRQLLPAFPGLSADGLEFSRDRQWMAYVTYPQGDLWRSRLDGTQRQQLTSAPLKPFQPRWSPDGRLLVFSARSPGQPWRLYVMPASGGLPKEILPANRPTDSRTPSWSPDGKTLVTSSPTPSLSLVFYDIQSGKISPVPGSAGLAEPRWSPDGRYISALRTADGTVLLFDVGQQQWREGVAPKRCAFQSWTSDSSQFYCMVGKGESIAQFDVKTGRSENLVDLNKYHIARSLYNSWLGVSADDAPLVLIDVGTQEIYSLEWREQ
jgi:Tol biopolymer transport system component